MTNEKHRYILKVENTKENEKMLEQFRKLYNKTNIKSKVVLRYSHLNKNKMLNEKMNNLDYDFKELIFSFINDSELFEHFNINEECKYRYNNGSMRKDICDYIRVYINTN